MSTDTPTRSRKGDRAILAATAVVVGVVAAACTVLSYHGLFELARSEGPAGLERWAWLWPIIPDGLLVVGAGAVLSAERKNARDEVRKGWLILAAGTLISILAQTSLAPDMDRGALLVAGTPPAVLAIVWAYLMRMIRIGMEATEPGEQSEPEAGTVRAADTGQGPDAGTATGHRQGEADAPGGHATVSPNPGGVRGVAGRREQSGRADGSTGRLPGRQPGQTGPGQGVVARAGSGYDKDLQDRTAWRVMTEAAAEGRDLSGRTLVQEVAAITGYQSDERTGRRWKETFEGQRPRLEIVGE